MRKRGVTQAEIDRAKARSELGALQSLEAVSGKAEQIGFYDVVLGDPAAQFDRLAQLRRVTLSDVLRVARRYLVNSARTIVLVRPDEEALAASDGAGERALLRSSACRRRTRIRASRSSPRSAPSCSPRTRGAACAP